MAIGNELRSRKDHPDSIEPIGPALDAAVSATIEITEIDMGDVRVAGDRHINPGNPLVILSGGGGGTWHSWRGAAERLDVLGFESISLDLRGHGDFGWPGVEGYAPDRNDAFMDAVADFLLRTLA